jgi:hypothetical protein
MTMDILIMILLLATAIFTYRGTAAKWVLSLWTISLIAMLLLFNHHVTSSLNLNF